MVLNANSTISRLGRYQLSRVLGQGAMGVVYEGLDPLLNRQVAVKTILRSALGDPETISDTSARFVREAQAIARLSHPHIVTVFDFGEEGDVAYFVMEFVRGRELKGFLDGGERFSRDEAVRIVGELLAALDFAHRQGIVHRDVKPANVMLDAQRRVKLTDFGVARMTDAGGDRTQAGTMVGTPSYMSPEQIQGLPVGSRTDLFAVGIILYQFLTGTKPFPGPGVWAVQKQIVHEDPVPPSVAEPAVDPRFDAVIARALAKDPADRYASAAEFAADLEQVHREVGAADNGRAEATEPPMPRSPSPGVSRRPAAADEATEVPPARVSAGSASEAAGETTFMSPPPGTAELAPRHSRWGWGLAAVLAVGVTAWFLTRPPAPAPEPMPELPAAKPAVPDRSPSAAPAPTPAVPAPATEPSASPPAKPAAVPAPAVPPAAQSSGEARPAERTPEAVPAPAPGVRDAAKGEPAVKPKTTPRPETAAPVARRTSSARCEELMQRFQLGEGLSPDDLVVLQKECKR